MHRLVELCTYEHVFGVDVHVGVRVFELVRCADRRQFAGAVASDLYGRGVTPPTICRGAKDAKQMCRLIFDPLILGAAFRKKTYFSLYLNRLKVEHIR